MSGKKRQLAAIVFTDIVGYSKMMATDEAKAKEVRERHRAIFQEMHDKYDGTILQYYGDGTLSVFSSSVAAVECSVAIQKACQEAPRVPLRIGIHLGDITFDKEEIYGDGVNVASRVESASLPGTILLSEKVYDDIKNHTWLKPKSLGSYEFKNIPRPMEVYTVEPEGLPTAPLEEWEEAILASTKVTGIPGVSPARFKRDRSYRKPVLAVLGSLIFIAVAVILLQQFLGNGPNNGLFGAAGNKQSIAVLPFTNMSDVENQDFFSDGITEDILTLLAQIEELNVISRTSIMGYKGTNKSIREIGKELNANHILEGSVRRNDDQVRITAQLVDARNDKNLWAKTYDRKLEEVFAVQSEVATDIAKALKVKLSLQEASLINKKPTTNLEAYDFYKQGLAYYRNYQERDNELAIQLYKNALEVDGNYALAYAGLGDAFAQKAFRYAHDPVLLDTAILYAKRAIQLDSTLSEGHKALGLSLHYGGKYDEAMDAYLDAIRYNPNNEMAIGNLSILYHIKGQLVDAIRWAKRALQLKPNDKWVMVQLSDIYFNLQMYDKVIPILERVIQLNPDFFLAYEKIGASYLYQENFGLAQDYAEQCIAMNPEATTGYKLKAWIAYLQKDYETALEQLRIARSKNPKKAEHEFDWDTELSYGYLLIKTGDTEQGRSTLEGLIERFDDMDGMQNDPDYQYLYAMMEGALGNDEEAMRHLQLAADNNWLDNIAAERNSIFESLHDTPAFKALMEEVSKKVARLQKEVELMEQEAGIPL